MTIVNLAPINQHFDFLYSSALEVANSQAIVSLENLQLPYLEPDQRVLKLQNELRKNRRETDAFDGKEYVQFATNKGFVCKIYVARMLFFEINDERKLREAFIHHTYHNLLKEQLRQAKAEVPDLMFVTFPGNEGDFVFRKLKGFTDYTGNVKEILLENKFNSEIAKKNTTDIEELLRSYQINDLIACMVPEPGLINRLFETNQRIESQIKNHRIPSSLIVEDIKSSYRGIYKMAFSSLKHLIESIEKDGMAVFIINQISDISYMEELADLDGNRLHDYFKHLKHFLQEQLHSIQSAQSFKQPDLTVLISKKETSVIKPISFGYQIGPRPLKPILVAMNLEFDLFGGSTTVDDVMEVLMCKDLSKNKKIIELAAKYNLIEGLRKRLKPWCSNLKPAVMEHSGIFIRLEEGPLKASSLYKSTPLLLEVEDKIDAIFKTKY